MSIMAYLGYELCKTYEPDEPCSFRGENFWIDENGNICRELSNDDIYAKYRNSGESIDRKRVCRYNCRMVKKYLYDDLPSKAIDYLPAEYIKLYWIRRFIIKEDIKTLEEYRQKFEEFSQEQLKIFLEKEYAEKHDLTKSHITTLDGFINNVKISRFVNQSGKRRVFDQVVVEMTLIQGDMSKSDMVQFIKKNSRPIKLMAVDVLRNSKKYAYYGVPINFLKFEKMTLTRDNVLELTFGLKIEAE